jgi:hypothetical protein
MLQCYVLMWAQLVTTFLAPPRSQRPGQGPRLPHPKASPDYVFIQKVLILIFTAAKTSYLICHNIKFQLEEYS